MSFATRHNKGTSWGVNTEGYEFKKLEDLYKSNGSEKVYICKGFIITKGKFGEGVSVITDGYFMNMPSHMIDEFKEILKSEEDINDIKSGKVGIQIYTYIDKTYNKTCFGARFIDI